MGHQFDFYVASNEITFALLFDRITNNAYAKGPLLPDGSTIGEYVTLNNVSSHEEAKEKLIESIEMKITKT